MPSSPVRFVVVPLTSRRSDCWTFARPSMDRSLSDAWAVVLSSLRLGPETLASHPSQVARLRVALPGLGLRSSDAVARTAVSLAFLRAFYERLVVPLSAGEPPLTTKAVVERFIKPLTEGVSCLADLLPPAAVGVPTAFVSHAWGTCHYGAPEPACGCAPGAGTFALLVDSVSHFFASAVPEEVFVWLDVFAINQHDASGSDLDGGKTLEKTLRLAAHTLVVLDRGAALPLTRLWCLFEIGSTPPEKLHLLTRGFAAAELCARFRALDVAAASCHDAADAPLFFDSFIRGEIRRHHGSEAFFEQKLRLRLLLRPLSYDADVDALLANATREAWRLDELRGFLRDGSSAGGDASRLACVLGSPGVGKSTLSAKLCREGAADAFHFCKASNVAHQDPAVVARSLAYQLATARADDTTLRFPAFADALLALDDAALKALGDPLHAFEVLLKAPLLALPRGERVVLLFDALDEAAAPGRPVGDVVNLLLSLGRLEGGPALSVVATTRPEAAILDALQARWRDGFRAFAPDALRAASASEASALLLLLRARLADQAGLVSDTPGDVDAAYALFFDAAPPDERCRRLVDVLLAARQPPSLMLLEELGMRAALPSLPGWGVLFYARDFCVHILHRSVSDWLLDARRSGAHACDVEAGHATWSDLLSKQLSRWLSDGGAAPPSDSYVYAHALAHLDACSRTAEACGLLLRLPWLQATLRERGVYALVADLAAHAQHDADVALLRRAVLLAVSGLQGAQAWELLPGALCARLVGVVGNAGTGDGIRRLYDAARGWRGERAWLRLMTATFAQCDGVVEMQLAGHTHVVKCVATLSDGRLVSGSADKTLRVWSPATGECERVLEGHTADVTSVAALNDSRLVSGSADNTLCVWSLAMGECERVLEGHAGWVWCIAALGDGRVVSGSADNTMRVWSLATGECERVLKGHARPVRCVAVLNDGRLVSGSADNTLRMWSLATGMCECVLKGHAGPVQCVAALHDGRVVSGSRGNSMTLCVWSLATGTCERVLEGHTDNVTSVAALSDGRLVSGSADKTLRVWSPATGECERVLEGHTEDVTSVAALNDSRLVSGSADNTLRVWSLATANNNRVLEGYDTAAHCVAALSDGRAVTGSADNTLRIWNMATGECERVLKGHAGPVRCVAALRNGRVVSGSADKRLRVWNLATGECERVLEGHTDKVFRVAELRDGRVVSGSHGLLCVWSLATGACELVLRGHQSWIWCMAALSDGRMVSGSADNTLRVWSSVTGECERVLNDGARVACMVALSNGRVVAQSGGVLRVWCPATGECCATMRDSVSARNALLAPGALFDTCFNHIGSWLVRIASVSALVPTRCDECIEASVLVDLDGGERAVVAITSRGVHVFRVMPPAAAMA